MSLKGGCLFFLPAWLSQLESLAILCNFLKTEFLPSLILNSQPLKKKLHF